MNVQNKTAQSVELNREADSYAMLSSEQKNQIKQRDSKYKKTDLSCLKTIRYVELYHTPNTDVYSKYPSDA